MACYLLTDILIFKIVLRIHPLRGTKSILCSIYSFSSLGPLMAVMMGRLMWVGGSVVCVELCFIFVFFFIFVTNFSGLP